MSYADFNATKAGHQINGKPAQVKRDNRDAYPFHRDLAMEVQIEAAILQRRVTQR
jgi:hypothetical protein